MRLDWYKSVLYVAAMGTVGCWLYAIIAGASRQVADGQLSVIGLLVLYPVSFAFNKLLQRLRWHQILVRTVTWLAWAAAILLMVKAQLYNSMAFTDAAWLMAIGQAFANIFYTFRPELLILAGGAGIWWLGVRTAQLRMSFDTLMAVFQFGLAVMAITFFVTYQVGVGLKDSIPLIVAYFLFALLGISVAHAKEGVSWLSGLNRGHWAGLLLVSISLIIVLGLVIGSVVNSDFLQIIVDGLKWLWAAITRLITLIASLIPQSEPTELPPMPAPAIPPTEEHNIWTLPESVRRGLGIMLNILWAGLILFALWRLSSYIVRLLRRRLGGMAGAEVEPLPGAFRADLLRLLKLILLRLFGFVRVFKLKRKPDIMLPEIASVRQIYRQLLDWAAAGGHPRLVYQTPNEYLGTLAGVLPEAQDELSFITKQYVSTRYGRTPPTENELSRLKQSWHWVKQHRIRKPESRTDNE